MMGGAIRHLLFSAVVAGMVSGCMMRGTETMPVQRVTYQELSGWELEDHRALVPLLRRECHRLAQLPPETPLGGARSLPYGRQAGAWAGVCAALPVSNVTSENEARQYFETWFVPYAVGGEAFYTGYYEPQVEAALEHVGAYHVPVYRRPADLVRQKDADGKTVFGRVVNGKMVPYDDRAAIDAGSLEGRHLEVAWVKDPVDLFVLQLQGSGRLHLPGGHVVRVAYDGHNGQPYVPIGRTLVEEGILRSSEVTADSIQAWLKEHPEQARHFLEKNPQYVFLHLVDRPLQEGPKGAFGVSLTPGRSVAVDRRFVPFAMPVWVETTMPDMQGTEGLWHRLTFAQDVGTDIRGAGRADIFTGWGEAARVIAGGLHGHGRMVVLVPRPPAGAMEASSAP